MAANTAVPGGDINNRQYVAIMAEHNGWTVTKEGYLDTYTWPHPVDLGDGGDEIVVEPNTILWDETHHLMLQLDGEDVPEYLSHRHLVAAVFGQMFTDPAGVERFGPELVRKWVKS